MSALLHVGNHSSAGKTVRPAGQGNFAVSLVLAA